MVAGTKQSFQEGGWMVRDHRMMEAEVRAVWGHEPRNTGSLDTAKGEEIDSPQGLPKERSPANPFQTPDLQNCNIINVLL